MGFIRSLVTDGPLPVGLVFVNDKVITVPVNETDINPPAVLGRLTERGAISGVKENLRCIICVGLANHTDTTEVSNGQSKSST